MGNTVKRGGWGGGFQCHFMVALLWIQFVKNFHQKGRMGTVKSLDSRTPTDPLRLQSYLTDYIYLAVFTVPPPPHFRTTEYRKC